MKLLACKCVQGDGRSLSELATYDIYGATRGWSEGYSQQACKAQLQADFPPLDCPTYINHTLNWLIWLPILFMEDSMLEETWESELPMELIFSAPEAMSSILSLMLIVES